MSSAPKQTPRKGKKRAAATSSQLEPISIVPSPSAVSATSEDAGSVSQHKKKRFPWRNCEERLVDWITGPEGSGENYKRWKSTSTSATTSSTRKISGDSKKQIAAEIAAEFVSPGFTAATGRIVQNKIEALETTYKNALTCLRETGFGIDNDDIKRNITTLDQKVLVLCPHYKRQDPVLGERPAFNPPVIGGSLDNPTDLTRYLAVEETLNLGDDCSDNEPEVTGSVDVDGDAADGSDAESPPNLGTQARVRRFESSEGCTVLSKPEFVKHYRALMDDETFYEESTAVTWEVKIVDAMKHGINEKGAGHIHFAIGMSRLFLKQEMESFAAALDAYENDDPEVSVLEVVERWDSMGTQITTIHAAFEKLEMLSANSWNKPEKRAPPSTPEIPKSSTAAVTKPNPTAVFPKPAPSQQRKGSHIETMSKSKGSNASASIDNLTDAKRDYWENKLKLQAQKQKQAEKKDEQDHEYRMEELVMRKSIAAASEKDAEARKEETLTSRMMVDYLRAQLPFPK